MRLASQILLPVAAFSLLVLAACGAAPQPPAGDAAAPATATATAPAAAAEADAPAPDAMGELSGALDALGGVRSYHATMDIESAAGAVRSELDFVAPDRFRMTLPGVGTQTVIGHTMYMEAGGRVTRMEVPPGTLDQWRNPARLDDPAQKAVVQAMGADTVDGQPARRYAVRSQGDAAADITMWIGPDNLPLQVRVVSTAGGEAATSTLRYSRFNDPSIEITPPQ